MADRRRLPARMPVNMSRPLLKSSLVSGPDNEMRTAGGACLVPTVNFSAQNTFTPAARAWDSSSWDQNQVMLFDEGSDPLPPVVGR
jgi:hypothetical protein